MRFKSLRLRFAAALLLLALDAAWGGAHGSLNAITRSNDAYCRSPSRQRLGAGGHRILAEEKRPLMVLRGGFVAEDTITEPSPPGNTVTDGDEGMAELGSNAETETEGETDLPWKQRGLTLRRRGKGKGEEEDGQEGKGAKPAKRPRGRPRLPPGKDRKRYFEVTCRFLPTNPMPFHPRHAKNCYFRRTHTGRRTLCCDPILL